MSEPKTLKILLAEDNQINQRIAVFTFNRLGITCDIASDGQEAFDMHCQNGYNLILMDMQMPVMDGLEATRKIRIFENETNPDRHVYIVALTANMISDKKGECIQAGMDDFMEKPFNEDALRALFSKSFN